MASTGKRYQSHAATIRRWAGEDAKKTVTPSRNRDYSVKAVSYTHLDTLAMKYMREELKAVERLRKTAEQLSRQERNKSHDREPER